MKRDKLNKNRHYEGEIFDNQFEELIKIEHRRSNPPLPLDCHENLLFSRNDALLIRINFYSWGVTRRVNMAEITHPIIGDPKYFNKENWKLPGGIQNKLHLHARRIVIPHTRGKGTIDVSSPLPEHMQQTFNLVGWDVKQYDPITESPEE